VKDADLAEERKTKDMIGEEKREIGEERERCERRRRRRGRQDVRRHPVSQTHDDALSRERKGANTLQAHRNAPSKERKKV
jgi:hypothetical protein